MPLQCKIKLLVKSLSKGSSPKSNSTTHIIIHIIIHNSVNRILVEVLTTNCSYWQRGGSDPLPKTLLGNLYARQRVNTPLTAENEGQISRVSAHWVLNMPYGDI